MGYTHLANSPLVAQVGYTNGTTGIMTTVKRYDLLNRLTAIENAVGVVPVSSFACEYNAANQRPVARREDGASWRYECDKLGQATSGRQYWSDGTPAARDSDDGEMDCGTAVDGHTDAPALLAPTRRQASMKLWTPSRCGSGRRLCHGGH